MHKIRLINIFIILVVNILTAGSSNKSVKAIRTNEPIIIDGKNSENAWSKTKGTTDFFQRDPIEGSAPTELTEVKILFDDEAIYFFCQMFDSNPAGIIQRLGRRDDDVESDDISITIDSYHDHQSSIVFRINAAGTKGDGLYSEDGRNRDFSWDAVWDATTKINESGWSAEFKIPFSVLRFKPSDSETILGINFSRKIIRKQEFLIWSPIKKSESGWISRYGHLTGITNIPSPKALEVNPYLIGTGKFFPSEESKVRVAGLFPNVGLDAKYGISGNTFLNLTINPDFGQVEVDPSQLNLSTIETFYAERRPFFVEGSDIFNFSTFGQGSGPGLFYSRRIGKAIYVNAPEGGKILSEPLSATILGAGKLAGQTESGLSFGILSAVTEKEFFTYSDQNGIEHNQLASEGMNYNLIRLKQNILSGSSVGMILTSRTGANLRPATIGGVDWRLRFLDNKYSISGYFASSASDTSHPANAEDFFKNNSAGRISFSKEGGENWLFDVGYYYTGPKYYINDVGYFRRPDDYGSYNNVTYKDDKPGEIFRFYRLTIPYHFQYNINGDLLIHETGFRWYSKLANYSEFKGELNYSLPAYDDRESRGYGLYKKPGGVTMDIGIESDESKDFGFGIGVGGGINDFGGNGIGIGGGTFYRPSSSSEIGISFMSKNIFKEESYVTGVNDTSIFGDRNVRQNDITIRGSILFNPNTSIQLYTQYFTARGMYENFGKLINTKVEKSNYNGETNFNSTQLNLNLVIRWEYLPGSVLYAVWAHNREWGDGVYHTTFKDQFNNTFKVAPRNVFTLKLSYWLNV